MSKYRGGGSSHASDNINAVFYADAYHPIQAGSIDGTDVLPHDNAIYRALLCSSAGLYDPNGDPKILGDPYCTIFVGRLSSYTTEDSLLKAMSRYGRVKNLRLVRHIGEIFYVTGASCGYAFVEYETEREMQHAYEDAHHTIIDDSEIIVDFNRQQLMPGWIPRRLGGGLGGRKESGQLRFGGRERPFRAPLRPIPRDDLKRLGIPLPPEGHYMSRFQVPPLPRRRSPVKDHNSAVSDVAGKAPYRSLEESEKRAAEEQLEYRRDSDSSRKDKRKTNWESHHDEHMYSSEEDKSRHKHSRRYESMHDHQRHRALSPLGRNFAATEMTEDYSYYASESTQKGSVDEYVGQRWSEHSEKQVRTKNKVDSSYYGSSEDYRHRHHHRPKSSHDHKQRRKPSDRHEEGSGAGENLS